MSRKNRLNRLQGGLHHAIRRKFKAKKINYLKFLTRHFGQVPYFDVETGKKADLRTYLSATSRKPGISGFMRLKNEEHFVEASIESVIECLDELIIVYNGCTDRTPEIIETCRLRYPDRIRVFEYEPEVFPPGSVRHSQEPMGSPHSLVNYYNYALAKTSRKVAIKIDGDELFLSEAFKQLTDEIRAGKCSAPIGVSGINLWDDNGEISVNASHPVKSGLDKGFFKVSPRSFFVHHRHYELFTFAFERSAGIYYYHLKGLKNDRGINAYVVQSGATTFSSSKINALTSPELMSWRDFTLLMDEPESFTDPEKLDLPARPESGSGKCH